MIVCCGEALVDLVPDPATRALLRCAMSRRAVWWLSLGGGWMTVASSLNAVATRRKGLVSTPSS